MVDLSLTHSLPLKPCPFCGYEAHMQERYTDGGRIVFVGACEECGASVEGMDWINGEGLPGFDSEEEAAAAWNRRSEVRSNG